MQWGLKYFKFAFDSGGIRLKMSTAGRGIFVGFNFKIFK